MMRSLNEIETTLRKAAIGGGLPVGAADDIGRAAGWLSAEGFDGVAAALRGLASPPGAATAEKTPGGLRFPDARAAGAGIAALDLLLAGAAEGAVRLENLDAPLLLLGLAGVAASAHRTAFALESDGFRAEVTADATTVSGPVPSPGRPVSLRKLADLSAEATAGRNIGGIDVPDEAWAEALRLASLTYVPASDRSRLSGAGAGLRDND